LYHNSKKVSIAINDLFDSEVRNHKDMNEHQFNERILDLLMAQEFGEISEAKKEELLNLLEQDEANGGEYNKLVNDRDKLIDHIVEFTNPDKDEEKLRRAKDEILEKIKGKQS
jgi:hypothetical protein